MPTPRAALSLRLSACIAGVAAAGLSPPSPGPASVHGAAGQRTVAQTDCGAVEGAWDPKFRSFAFRGIPYAMPPLGPRRWRRSELLSTGGGCWDGTLDTRWRTDAFMDSQCCAQNPSRHRQGVRWDGVEDCLTLDVRSPMDASSSLRPVLVSIHGGGLMGGTPDIPYGLRGEGFVVVGIRYRLNVLGFLAARELAEQDPSGVSGNYGFSDQVTALQWLQLNVRAFGGDPTRVTLIGCSSGGSSLWNLLAIPSARGLFSRAIPLSAASRNNMALDEAQQQNAVFVNFVCGNLSVGAYSCLREASLEQLMGGFMNLSSAVGFDHPFDFELPSPSEKQAGVAIVDGAVVERDLQKALSSSDSHSHVPLLSGSCSQEGHTQWLSTSSTAYDYARVVQGFVRNLTSARWPQGAASRILQLYPPTSAEFYGQPKAAMDAMIADIRVVCGTIFNAERLVRGRSHGVPARALDLWLYYSDMRAAGGEEMLHCDTMRALCDMDCSPCSPEKKAFYENMIYVHSEFIKTGRPPPDSLRRFANVDAHGSRDYILNIIAGNITSAHSTLKERCDFWQSTDILKSYAWNELGTLLQFI